MLNIYVAHQKSFFKMIHKIQQKKITALQALIHHPLGPIVIGFFSSLCFESFSCPVWLHHEIQSGHTIITGKGVVEICSEPYLLGLDIQVGMRYLCTILTETYPDSKVYGTNMRPTWVLSAPDGPHAGPMNLTIKIDIIQLTLPHTYVIMNNLTQKFHQAYQFFAVSNPLFIIYTLHIPQ